MSEASGHPIGNGQSINVSNQQFLCCGGSNNDNNNNAIVLIQVTKMLLSKLLS